MPSQKTPIEQLIDEITHTTTIVVAKHGEYTGLFPDRGHQHADLYQLSYLLKGQTRVQIGVRRYAVRVGDLLLINPGQWHVSAPGEKEQKLVLLELKFRLGRHLPLGCPAHINIGQPPDFLACFHSIINEFHMRRLQREPIMRLELARLLLLVHHYNSCKGKGYGLSLSADALRVKRCMDKAMCYIQANYARRLTLAEIARISGCGVSTFAHTFKRYAGVSPIGYLINYRLSMALDRMRNTEKKLEDIAGETGFSSTHYFSRLFKKRYHQPPRRYARMIYKSS